mmetsp:Transcript_41703/g.87501  ORF Transcript_41703/g.87501 Transcript_41703/m.87501 type:complete len:311 (+) Transcript_41703:416-1348(+)
MHEAQCTLSILLPQIMRTNQRAGRKLRACIRLQQRKYRTRQRMHLHHPPLHVPSKLGGIFRPQPLHTPLPRGNLHGFLLITRLRRCRRLRHVFVSRIPISIEWNSIFDGGRLIEEGLGEVEYGIDVVVGYAVVGDGEESDGAGGIPHLFGEDGWGVGGHVDGWDCDDGGVFGDGGCVGGGTLAEGCRGWSWNVDVVDIVDIVVVIGDNILLAVAKCGERFHCHYRYFSCGLDLLGFFFLVNVVFLCVSVSYVFFSLFFFHGEWRCIPFLFGRWCIKVYKTNFHISILILHPFFFCCPYIRFCGGGFFAST